MTIIAGTCGYARDSKADDESKNLDTQLLLLAEHGIRPDLFYSDVARGRNLQRPGWKELIAQVQEGDTVVVAFLDRLSRNFEDGILIQAELTLRNIGIVAIRKNIDTREGRRRSEVLPPFDAGPGGLPGGFGQRADPAGAGPGPRQWKAMGRRPALSHEQAEQCRRMAGEGTGLRHIARVMGCSPATVRKVLGSAGE